MWKISEKQLFFRADMAGLGKYHTDGYGRIGVYRVNILNPLELAVKIGRQMLSDYSRRYNQLIAAPILVSIKIKPMHSSVSYQQVIYHKYDWLGHELPSA